MNALTLNQLKILVERAVRPVRASASRTRKMREELLAHVTAVFEEERAKLPDDETALARTAQRFGAPAELTAQLQASVPALDVIDRLMERFTGVLSFRSDESTLSRTVRYTLLVEVAALLLYFGMLLLLHGVVRVWPTEEVWRSYPFLLVTACLGFTLGIVESPMHRLLSERTRRPWRQLAVGLVVSTIVSMPLGVLAFGFSPNKALGIFLFTVGFPLLLSIVLAHGFASRNRNQEDWTTLQVE
jgi:uncharacterized membrane protein HdeD (DUF308 family)